MGLSEALSAAQGQFEAIQKHIKVDFKTKDGRQIKYSYAPLSTILEAVKKPLSSNGLALYQTLGYMDNRFGLLTCLKHGDEKIESFVDLPLPIDTKPQEFASFLTYYRRYSITCILGIESEEDSANNESGEDLPKPAKRVVKNHAPGAERSPQVLTTIEQITQVAKSLGMTNAAISDSIKRSTGKSAAKECSEDELKTVLKYLKMKVPNEVTA